MTNDRAVAAGLDLTVDSAAEAITAAGGIGHAVPCDLSRDADVQAAIQTATKAEGRLDLLVCSAFTTPPGEIRGDFWEQGVEMWDACNGVGLRSTYATCVHATPAMIATAADRSLSTPPPLIVLVSSFGGKSYTFNVAYGVGKCAIDRLASDMSYQLKKHRVATVSLYPGVVATEGNLQMLQDGTWDKASGGKMDLLAGESPELSGKAVAALAALDEAALMAKSGSVQVVAELGRSLDFAESDGRQPPSIRSLQYLAPNYIFPQIEAERGEALPDWLKQNVPDVLLPWGVFSSGPPPEPEEAEAEAGASGSADDGAGGAGGAAAAASRAASASAAKD